MAINTLRGVKEIEGHKVCVMDELREKHPEKFNASGAMDYKWFEKEIRPNFDIFLRHDVDSLSFNMMTDPVELGGKGCQFTTLIQAALIMLKYLNDKFPCRENAITITKLQEALFWQESRTKDREARGVEGTNQK